jgi:hypothetical protein
LLVMNLAALRWMLSTLLMLKLMPPSSRRTLMPCKTGKVPGRCHLIPTSVRYYASPTSVIRSWQIIISKKAGDQGQCLGGRQKSLYIVQSVYRPEVRHLSVGPYQGRLQGLVVRISWLSVERFFRNPCCNSERTLLL